MDISERVKSISDSVNAGMVRHEEYSMLIAAQQQKKIDIQENILDAEKIMTALSNAGTKMRSIAKHHIENVVTEALKFVSNSNDYEFIVDERELRGKPSYEFYIKTTVNGHESLQKPQEASGGGFVDIISAAIKYAYLEAYNDPKIMLGTMILDEPGKMVSSNMSVEFAKYIKTLGKYFNKQTIMVTHNDDLSATADKTFIVSKSPAGISTVIDEDSIQINNSLFAGMEEEL